MEGREVTVTVWDMLANFPTADNFAVHKTSLTQSGRHCWQRYQPHSAVTYDLSRSRAVSHKYRRCLVQTQYATVWLRLSGLGQTAADRYSTVWNMTLHRMENERLLHYIWYSAIWYDSADCV